jgi:hypothetical protein
MKQIVQRTAGPALGVALGYFAVVLWAVPNGYVVEANQTEAAAMAGVVGVHVINELYGFFSWIGSLFVKKEK